MAALAWSGARPVRRRLRTCRTPETGSCKFGVRGRALAARAEFSQLTFREARLSFSITSVHALRYDFVTRAPRKLSSFGADSTAVESPRTLSERRHCLRRPNIPTTLWRVIRPAGYAIERADTIADRAADFCRTEKDRFNCARQPDCCRTRHFRVPQLRRRSYLPGRRHRQPSSQPRATKMPPGRTRRMTDKPV